MNELEKIIKEYLPNIIDVNQSETVEILPLTIVDMMIEYHESKNENLNSSDIMHRIEELIKEYYTLEKEYKIYTNLLIPYRKEDFTICEPNNILYRKKSYEDVFYWLKLKVKLWSEYD